MKTYKEFNVRPVTEKDGVVRIAIEAWEDNDRIDEGRTIVELEAKKGSDYTNYHYYLEHAELNSGVIQAIATADKQLNRHLKGPIYTWPREERWAAVDNFLPNALSHDSEFDFDELMEEINKEQAADIESLEIVVRILKEWRDKGHVSRDGHDTLNRLYKDAAAELNELKEQ